MAGNLLRSGTDYYIVRICINATETVNILGNFVAQSRLALWVTFKKKKLGVVVKNSGSTFFPLGEVEALKVIKIRRLFECVIAEIFCG